MFDSAIRHPQSILVSIILPVFRCALDDLPEAGNVFRVNSFAHDEFNARRGRPVVQLKNPEGFVRPVGFPAGTPTKTAGVAQSLCLSQVCIRVSQVRVEAGSLKGGCGLWWVQSLG